MFLKWKTLICTGNEVIDLQHKALYQKFEDLLENTETPFSLEDIQKEFQFFEGFVIEHFTDEELLHLECGAPYYEEHVMAHLQLIGLTDQRVKQLKGEGFTATAKLQLYHGFMEEFIDQILQFDMPLAKYIHEEKKR